MEEKIIDGEQPQVDEQTLVQEEHSIVQDSMTGSLKNSKFKTEQELLRAYENLEREYTKKCQKLATLEKGLDNAKAPNQDEKFLAELNKFYEQVPLAKNFQNELLSKSVERGEITKDSLYQDYVEILGQAYTTEKEKNSDSNLLFDKVINNDEIKNKIIGDYIDKVKSNKTTPFVKAGDGGYVISPKVAPKTLQEAGNLVKQILK